MTIPSQELVRGALAAAQTEAAVLNSAALAQMVCAVQRGAIEHLTPTQRAQVLVRALMAPYPVGFFRTLRDCGGLRRLLPEVDALFGVPLISNGAEPVDVGEHQLRVLAVTARRRAPLEVRFAALLHKIGMGGTRAECWPSHPGHEARGRALLDAIAERIALPAPVADLAALAIAEVDRVHRATDMRAGAVAALLERVRAEPQPQRFEQLLLVCACDYAAYPGHHGAGHDGADYPKAGLLRRALAAYLTVQAPDASGDGLNARAEAIARAAGLGRGTG